MSYEPRPGSTAQRVIAHLETLPHGAEVLTSTIAMALGMQANSIPTCMEGALAAGAVFRRKRDPHLRAPLYWSLVNHEAAKTTAPHTPLVVNVARAQPDAVNDVPAEVVAQLSPRAQRAIANGVSVEQAIETPPAERAQRTGVAQQFLAHAARTSAAQPGPLRIALWSDGTLVVDSGAPRGAVTYTADETRQIVAYLDKVLLDRRTQP